MTRVVAFLDTINESPESHVCLATTPSTPVISIDFNVPLLSKNFCHLTLQSISVNYVHLIAIKILPYIVCSFSLLQICSTRRRRSTASASTTDPTRASAAAEAAVEDSHPSRTRAVNGRVNRFDSLIHYSPYLISLTCLLAQELQIDN